MDVSNVTTKSVSSSPAKTPANANLPVVQGNSMPDVRQLDVRLEKIQVESPGETSSAKTPSAAELRELVGQANEALQARFSDLKFTVDERTDISIVRIEDSETGELIRQFPSEAMLAIARALEDMQQSVVFEDQA